jgi:hypothetical protein
MQRRMDDGKHPLLDPGLRRPSSNPIGAKPGTFYNRPTNLQSSTRLGKTTQVLGAPLGVAFFKTRKAPEMKSKLFIFCAALVLCVFAGAPRTSSQGFTYSNGNYSLFSAGLDTQVFGINDLNQVVGIIQASPNANEGFIYSSGNVTILSD